MHPRTVTLLGLLTIVPFLGAAENPAAASPLLPATPPPAASPAPAQPVRWELAGVIGIRETLTVRINDTVEKTGAWLRVGESFGVLKLIAADADTATIQVGDERAVLGLLVKGVAAGEATPATTAAATASAPAPLPSTGDAAADAKRDQAIAEREARMLVSDLLEISMIQRKEYEDKQAAVTKAAAETAAATVP